MNKKRVTCSDCLAEISDERPATKEVAVPTGVIPVDDRAQRIKNLQDLVETIFWRVQNLREVYLHNHNLGCRLEEIGPYDPPFDYKLNQLTADVIELRSLFGGPREGTEGPQTKEIASATGVIKQ